VDISSGQWRLNVKVGLEEKIIIIMLLGNSVINMFWLWRWALLWIMIHISYLFGAMKRNPFLYFFLRISIWFLLHRRRRFVFSPPSSFLTVVRINFVRITFSSKIRSNSFRSAWFCQFVFRYAIQNFLYLAKGKSIFINVGISDGNTKHKKISYC
jgi:hypothetical protein